MQQAQKAKEEASTRVSANANIKAKDVEENVVILTRTGRDGTVRPLPEQEYNIGMGGKRRKKKTVSKN